jgi:hypothetical protein
MGTSFERRVEALEQAAGPQEGITLIAIQIVRPGSPKDENRFCCIDGEKHSRRSDETAEDFDARMMVLANDLNKRRGKPIRIICSPVDAGL